jgi:hypothetical protein
LSPTANSEVLAFQLLSCLVDIRYQDPALRATFAYLAGRPRQHFPIRKTLSYQVTGSSPYDILEEGDELDRVARAPDVLHLVYRRVYRRVLERYALAGWVALHAALATIGGRRTLILGDKGAGKTTLATRLLYAGHAVEGDELVLVRNGQAVAMPRAFHLKPGAEEQIPELAGRILQLPKMYTGNIGIAALDPSQLGFDWTIAVGAVERVVWITANHGGQTLLEPRPSFAAIQRILESSLIWDGTRRELVAVAAGLGGNGGYELVLGDPQAAVHLLESLDPACHSG